MISYNELYEILRKEKNAEVLQPLGADFIEQVAEYLNDKKGQAEVDDGMFQDSVMKNKKQYENSIAIFKELMLRRKKKILNLIFVATETGIMKRDYENMLHLEQEVFDKMVKIFEEGDKILTRALQGIKSEAVSANRMVLFNSAVDQFIDMAGNPIGPFASGELANLDGGVAEILVSGGKARFVDEATSQIRNSSQ
ncbi:MAG: hypothetical protein AABX11_03675 [Nanoarchaeota archaeon]